MVDLTPIKESLLKELTALIKSRKPMKKDNGA
jgi:hypothetical protein